MAKKFQLRKYLLISFFIALVLVGIMQLLVNILFGDLLNDLFDSILHMEDVTSNSSISNLGPKALVNIILIIAASTFGEIVSFIDMVFNTNIEAAVNGSLLDSTSSIFQNVSSGEITTHFLKIALLLLLIIFIWIVPFVVGGIVFAINVSKKIKQVEEERTEKEKSYEKQRTIFLTDVAHDIKTPMTTIAGYSRALVEGSVPKEKQQEYLYTIYSKTMQANELVSVLFEYVKLDSAEFILDLEREDICELVRECVANLYMDYEKNGIEVIPKIPEELLFVKIDKIQTKRAINNLLVNSFKHNPKGTIVKVSVVGKKNEVIINISDNGNSISRETGGHIFDPFVQEDKSRLYGSGLGLSITKKIIDAQNGKIILYQYLEPEKQGIVKNFEITFPRVK